MITHDDVVLALSNSGESAEIGTILPLLEAFERTHDIFPVLQALDLESELPPAGSPVDLHGSDLSFEDGSRATDASAGTQSFRAGPKGSRVTLEVAIPATGLYTLSIFGVPGWPSFESAG